MTNLQIKNPVLDAPCTVYLEFHNYENGCSRFFDSLWDAIVGLEGMEACEHLQIAHIEMGSDYYQFAVSDVQDLNGSIMDIIVNVIASSNIFKLNPPSSNYIH